MGLILPQNFTVHVSKTYHPNDKARQYFSEIPLLIELVQYYSWSSKVVVRIEFHGMCTGSLCIYGPFKKT